MQDGRLALWICAVSAAFVAYEIVLYPAALHVMARLFGRSVQRGPYAPTVSVVLAVRNGARWLPRKLQSLAALDYPQELLEIVVVSDGSTDETAAIARNFQQSPVKAYEIEPQGKWAALNRGIEEASGDVLFFTDVRQGIDPPALRRLLENLADPAVGAVSGELILLSPASAEEQAIGLYWRYEKWIRKNLSVLGSMTGATGAIYAMRRELARPLPPHTLDDDVYLPLCAVLAGRRVVFEPDARAYDRLVDLGREFRRKVRTLAGVYQTAFFLPELMAPWRPISIHFWSHKLGRLLVPFAMIAFFVASWMTPEPIRWMLLGIQALAVGPAALDFALPETFPGKRITASARSFFTLQAAALASAAILFRPARAFWR